MWFPKKEFKVINEALTLEDIKNVLEEKFPEYSISIEEKEDQKFIKWTSPSLLGAVNLTPQGVGGAEPNRGKTMP